VVEAGTDSAPLADEKKEVSLHKIIVDSHNKLRGKTIHDSGIRERTGGLVVGIERDGHRLINPESKLTFEWDDVVWVVGDWRKIRTLISE
jgi:monovalent cation:H+ antiporter-2, CPA2 family